MGDRSPFFALVDALVPPALGSHPDRLHAARVLAGAILLAVAIAAATGLAFWASGLTACAGITFAYGALVTAPLVMLRLGSGVARALNAALAITGAYFVANTLAQAPFDVSQVFWLAVLPLAAMFALGRRSGIVWTFIALALAIGLVSVAIMGWSIGQVPANPLVPTAARLVSFIGAIAGLALLFDTSRRRALEQAEEARAAAERASEAKSQFLANVSHELRTPMNAVVGLTDALLREPLTDAQREQLELVERSGRAMVALIGDLLDIAKIEAGQLELESTPFDLPRLAAEVGGLFEPNARAKKLKFHVSIASDVPRWVSGDPLRLRQVLANLVGNAVKFTEHGEVELAVSVRAEAVAFTVRDTGIGIPEHVQPRLFRKFFQADPSHTRRYGGTGLGLAIARELVERMDGTIDVESKPGAGTMMTVTVPLPRAESQSVPEVSRALDVPADRPSAATKPVLVVDDNPVNLKVMEIILRRLGIPLETAKNGREAVDRFAPGKYRMILMDVHMPELDGYSATTQIRACEGDHPRTPIVALTASVVASELDQCLEVGMDDCLTKPVTLDHLSRVLSALP
ncbi:ATP-binding protein [Myxococcota bacterium]|nr:ATP-binding protein [Myxococcota bacterium]